jgi:hypothetical protein
MTERQDSAGATAGLPGEQAAPQNSELTEDERDETVAMRDVAPPENDDHR